MLDAPYLQAFVAVAEERSFSRAGQRLAIAQSVISKRLMRLEDQLGAPLIERGGRSEIRLTRVGGLFLPKAREAIENMMRIERLGLNLMRGRNGPFRLGFVFSAAMCGVLTRILASLRKTLPELELQPVMLDTPEQLKAIGEGRLDAAIVRPRPAYPDDSYARVIHREHLMVALSADHPLARDQTVLPADLANDTFIVPHFHQNVGLIENLSAIARTGGFPMPKVMHTGDFLTATSLAAAGMGVALGPASLCNLHLDHIVFRPFQGPAAIVDLVLLLRKDAPSSAMEILLTRLFPEA